MQKTLLLILFALFWLMGIAQKNKSVVSGQLVDTLQK